VLCGFCGCLVEKPQATFFLWLTYDSALVIARQRESSFVGMISRQATRKAAHTTNLSLLLGELPDVHSSHPVLAGKHIRAPVESILMAVGAVIYFASSFDVIPDAVPVLGLVDDVWVINSVARAISEGSAAFGIGKFFQITGSRVVLW